MKKKTDEDLDELRSEYDLRKLKFVGRGIYAERYRSGTNLVLLEPDVRKAFPDDQSVNEALRKFAKAASSNLQGSPKVPFGTGDKHRGCDEQNNFEDKVREFDSIVL